MFWPQKGDGEPTSQMSCLKMIRGKMACLGGGQFTRDQDGKLEPWEGDYPCGGHLPQRVTAFLNNPLGDHTSPGAKEVRGRVGG